jgi:hypothetical protein
MGKWESVKKIDEWKDPNPSFYYKHKTTKTLCRSDPPLLSPIFEGIFKVCLVLW